MKRSLLAVMALGLLGFTTQAPAACRWFGSQLECDVGGSQLLIGTQGQPTPRCAGPLRLQPLQGCDGLPENGGTPESPFRLELQNIGTDPSLCRKLGNETYCY
jgi:hypothetical protein